MKCVVYDGNPEDTKLIEELERQMRDRCGDLVNVAVGIEDEDPEANQLFEVYCDGDSNMLLYSRYQKDISGYGEWGQDVINFILDYMEAEVSDDVWGGMRGEYQLDPADDQL